MKYYDNMNHREILVAAKAAHESGDLVESETLASVGISRNPPPEIGQELEEIIRDGDQQILAESYIPRGPISCVRSVFQKPVRLTRQQAAALEVAEYLQLAGWLGGTYDAVATNVPFLSRGKMK